MTGQSRWLRCSGNSCAINYTLDSEMPCAYPESEAYLFKRSENRRARRVNRVSKSLNPTSNFLEIHMYLLYWKFRKREGSVGEENNWKGKLHANIIALGKLNVAVEWEQPCKEEWWNMFPSWWCVRRKIQKFHEDTVSLENSGRSGHFYNSEMMVLHTAFFCWWNVCVIDTSSWGKPSVLWNCY